MDRPSVIFIYYGLLALAFGLMPAFDVATKQSSSARRIFHFMGWTGSLVVLVVSIGLPEQGAYQLLPMLPFVSSMFAIWFSRDRGKKTTVSNVVVGKKENKKFGPLTLSQVFLPLVALICWRIQWFKMSCFSLANQWMGAVPATLSIIQVERYHLCLGYNGYHLSVIVWRLLP